MQIKVRLIAAACLLALGGCQTLTEIADAIPPPTPEEQCQAGGGRWHAVTVYDANGNATDGGGECIQDSGPHKGRRP